MKTQKRKEKRKKDKITYEFPVIINHRKAGNSLLHKSIQCCKQRKKKQSSIRKPRLELELEGLSLRHTIPWSTVVVGLTTCKYSLVVMKSPTVKVPFLGRELAATPGAEEARTRGRNWRLRRRLERARRGNRRSGRREELGVAEEERGE